MTPDSRGFPHEAGYMAKLRLAVPTSTPVHWSYNPANKLPPLRVPRDLTKAAEFRAAMAELAKLKSK